MVRDVLVHALASANDVELMAEPPTSAPADGSTAAPDVVVVTTGNRTDVVEVTRLLRRWPRALVLCIRLDGHESMLFDLRPHGTTLGDLAPRELVDAIRTAVRQRELNATG